MTGACFPPRALPSCAPGPASPAPWHARGWALARPCREGYKIGPLVADDVSIARALAQSVCAALPPGERVALDVPLTNADAVELARELGLQPGFETARMYTGPAPRIEARRVFGITSFELG